MPNDDLASRAATNGLLRVYLLKTLPFDSYLALQRRLVYDVSGDAALATLVFCDHTPAISIGREGSRSHVRLSPEELLSREWRVHWVARGGGAMLHVPGQISVYPVLPLQQMGLNPADYTQKLVAAAKRVVERYVPDVGEDPTAPGLLVRSRSLLRVGAAIRFGVTAFGFTLNACPDLELFERIRCDTDGQPMTSLKRESAFRIELPNLRRELAESIRESFGFESAAYYHSQPQSLLKTLTHANLATSRSS